jgi:hypothetical protein
VLLLPVVSAAPVELVPVDVLVPLELLASVPGVAAESPPHASTLI